MKIGIFQDLHANLPALKKAIEVFKINECTKIYHVGDLIGIGPYPKEVLELSTSIQEMEFIMGNHDHWYGYGLSNPPPPYMNNDEVKHHLWTHHQIGKEYKDIVQNWKFVKELKLPHGRNITFQHYGYDEHTNWFKEFVKKPNKSEMNKLFEGINSDIVFYGHKHEPSDIQGQCKFVNLGSAGCFSKSEVRLGVLEVTDEKLKLQKLSILYDDDGFMEEFEKREVPAGDFIKKAFITRT